MANYNTRGQRHRQANGYDHIYNRGYCWHNLFDKLFNDIMAIGGDLIISNHVFNYEKNGNRHFDESEITFEAIKTGEVVEIETEEIYYDEDNDAQILMKAIVRLPKRDDGEQVVVVLDFSRNNIYVKAAWLNKANDNHQSGLDTSYLSWDFVGIFGIVFKEVEKFYKIDSLVNSSYTEL